MREQSREERVEGGTWILEHFTREGLVHERNAARRVLMEVVRAWPGDVHRLWWKWINEATASLGIRSKTLDCTVDEAVQLAADGAKLVCYHEAPNAEWTAVFGMRRSKFLMAIAGDIRENTSLSQRALRKRLEAASVDGQVRCVVIQPEPLESRIHAVQGGMRPLERLRLLLQPEWSDIWIVIVFAFVVGLLMLATPIAVEALVNTVAFGSFLQPILFLALILLTFLGFQAAARALQTYVVEIIQRRLFARVAADLAYRLPRTEIEATDDAHMPELVNRFFDVVTVQKVSAQLMLDGIGLVLATIVGMAVLGFYHPWLLGFDVLLLGFITFVIVVLGRGAIASAIKESKSKYLMAAWLEDIANCQVTFRNSGGSEFAMERADVLIHQYLSARKSHFRIVVRQILFALGFQAVASTVLLGLGGWLVITGELTLGQLVAAELIVTVIVGAFAKVGKHIESFYDLLASVDKLGALIDLPIEREDGMLGIKSEGPVAVELTEVTYNWKHQSSLAFPSFELEPGESLAITGPAGSGKSTLLDLIHGVRVPHSGHLTVDGFDPRDLRPDVLRNRISLVRRAEIFQATLEENIHLHRGEISAREVRDVFDHVGLNSVVQQLEGGFNTPLTSSGAPLSGNQQRLVCIARSVVSRPGLLLIDGTLDQLPDEQLMPLLNYLFDEAMPWTLVIASSRTEIIRRCSRHLDLGQHASTRTGGPTP